MNTSSEIASQEVDNEQFLNLEKVIEEKNPRLSKLIPGFVLRYIKRITRLDDLNEFLARQHDQYGLDFARVSIEEMEVTLIIRGKENIPAGKRFIVAANHPLGGPDGMALIHVVGQVQKDVIFPVNDILMNVENLKEMFVPINKHGSNAQNVKLIEDAFASDVAMLYFPAGLCSRKQSGRVVDLEWKKTFITKAIKHKRLIVPVHVDGKNTNFFYNLANLRKWLGIKVNIEMFYLVSEMYKQKGKTITFTFGKPIPFETFDKRHNHREWAARVKDYVYKLKKSPGLTFEEYMSVSG